VKAQIAAARKILDSQAPPTGQTPDERLRAIRVLSSLDSLEAAEELARRLTARQDAEAYQAGIWVVASPYRKQLLPLMERRLAAADQAVSGLYLDILARLSAVVALGGPGPPYSEDAAGRDAWLTASKQFAEVQKRKQDEYAERCSHPCRGNNRRLGRLRSSRCSIPSGGMARSRRGCPAWWQRWRPTSAT